MVCGLALLSRRIPQPDDPAGYSPRASEPLLITFQRADRDKMKLTWGPTHNCSVCCGPSTRVVEMCETNCENQTSTTWRVTPAAWDAPAAGLRLQTPTIPKAVRYAWSNFPQCVLFDEHALPVGAENVFFECFPYVCPEPVLAK
eukprot:COSAG06_NODE_14075_length_1192_cov_1.549863_1_plen_144_part_00